MMHSELDYICLCFDGALDGRGIYDKRLIGGLQQCGADVNVVEVRLQPRKLFQVPLWASQIAADVQGRLRPKARRVISHEMLIPLVLDISPDLFIVHNFVPAFSWPSELLYSSYYKFGSEQ